MYHLLLANIGFVSLDCITHIWTNFYEVTHVVWCARIYCWPHLIIWLWFSHLFSLNRRRNNKIGQIMVLSVPCFVPFPPKLKRMKWNKNRERHLIAIINNNIICVIKGELYSTTVNDDHACLVFFHPIN